VVGGRHGSSVQGIRRLASALCWTRGRPEGHLRLWKEW
jgi:hypothetical protein